MAFGHCSNRIARTGVMRVDAIDNFTTAAAAAKPAAAADVPATPAVQPAVQSTDRKTTQAAVNTANEVALASGSAVEFSIDEGSGGTIVRVIDTRTKEVIRQLPSEDMLRLRHALSTLQGLMFDQKV
jgi:flagellar protein FlaG